MAFSLTGGLILRTFKPLLVNPCYVIESTTSFQVRHAKRKGYREKMKREAQAKKAEKGASQEVGKVRKKKIGVIEKTVDFEDRPDPPDDDTYVENLFKIKKFSVAEAVKFHQEYHHPTVSNNPDAQVTAKIELNLSAKKKGGLKSIFGTASIPYPFKTKESQEILVLCDTEYIDLALKHGASIAGGENFVLKIKDGSLQPALYEHVICHVSFVPKIAPIRGLLKTKLPKMKEGTITADLKTTLEKFLYGIRYNARVLESPPDFGVMNCQIGVISQEPHQIEENFKALLNDLLSVANRKGADLIHWVWCLSPPSKEKFAIDINQYLKEKDTGVVEEEEDDDEDEEDDKTKEQRKIRKMEEELMEKEMKE